MLPHFLVAAVVLGGWEAICRVAAVPHYLVPSPTNIAASMIERRADLLTALRITLSESVVTIVISSVLGVGVAIVLSSSRLLERLTVPYIVVLQAVPIVATAPLILIWCGPNFHSIVIIAALMTVFPILSNTLTGLKATDRGLLDCFAVNGASAGQVLWLLRVPAALPFLGTGLKIACPLAVVGTIVGEYIAGLGSGSAGLGFLITQYALRLETAGVFAAALAAAAVAILFWQGVSWTTRLVLNHWHDSERTSE